MPTDDPQNDSRMEASEMKARILAASDENERIHAIYRTGRDEDIDYYLVVARKEYEGRPMLKIRYFAAHDDDPSRDTWMQNGINLRYTPELAQGLAKAVMAISKGHDPANTVEKDLRGDDPEQ